MEYLTGMKALNVPCCLNTTGDWHLNCFNWNKNELVNSSSSIFKDYGIEKNKKLPNGKITNVANHIRACLDMLEQGAFTKVQGMKNDFICTDEYNEKIFSLVLKLQSSSDWVKINDFMKRECKLLWIQYLERMNGYDAETRKT